MHTLQTIWRGLDWSVLTNLLLSVVPALLCITLHELAHGYVAYRLGDDTAKRAGRLTLNPLKHIDIMGLIMMVVLKFGWAKPVPVNMWKFKNPKKGMAITAAAGPLANLLVAFVFLFFYGLLFIPLTRLGNTGGYILEMIYITAYLSIALAIFNVIPIPPLDGSKVLFALLPDRMYLQLMRYERYGMLVLLLLVVFDVGSDVLSRGILAVFTALSDIAYFAGSCGLAQIAGLAAGFLVGRSPRWTGREKARLLPLFGAAGALALGLGGSQGGVVDYMGLDQWTSLLLLPLGYLAGQILPGAGLGAGMLLARRKNPVDKPQP